MDNKTVIRTSNFHKRNPRVKEKKETLKHNKGFVNKIYYYPDLEDSVHARNGFVYYN